MGDGWEALTERRRKKRKWKRSRRIEWAVKASASIESTSTNVGRVEDRLICWGEKE